MRPILVVLPTWALLVLSSIFALWCVISGWRGVSKSRAAGEDPDVAGAWQVSVFGVAQLVFFSVAVFGGWMDQFKIYSYGTCLMVGFGLAIALGVVLVRRRGLDWSPVIDMGLLAIVSAIFGSRLFYYVYNYEKRFADEPWTAFLRIDQGGMTVIGGVIFAGLAVGWYIRRNKLPGLAYADACAAPIPLGQAIGRLGCYMNGCCWGKPVEEGGFVANLFGSGCRFPRFLEEGADGVVMTVGSPPFMQHRDELGLVPDLPDVDLSMPIHPSQLYSSTASLILLVILLIVHSRKTREGMVLAAYGVLYPIQRFTVEFFRGDRLHNEDGVLVRGDWTFLGVRFSLFQAMVMVALPIMIVMAIYLLRRAEPIKDYLAGESAGPGPDQSDGSAGGDESSGNSSPDQGTA